ncbi:MAG: hypothetical protein P9L90_04700, partial [Candidatus Aadella gelida]|nr:hypothetical protein [Candidatus Aadella gelida]
NTIKADNFITEGYSQEIRVELRSNARVLSGSPTFAVDGNDGSNTLILSNRRMPNGTYGGVRGRQMK